MKSRPKVFFPKVFFEKLLLPFFLILFITSDFSYVQSSNARTIHNSHTHSSSAKINSNLRIIAEGNIESVRKELPKLIAEFGEDPGVMLLQAVVLENAAQAVPFYKRILEQHPNSEWAPHAAWRLIQYYSIVTDTATAKRRLERFRERYPTSPFLAPAAEAVRFSISDAKFRNIDQYLNPPTREVSATNVSNVATPAPVIAAVPVPAPQADKYGLQVGIYSTRAAAIAEKERFIKTARLRTEVLEKLILGETRYAVVIGNYDSEAEALRARATVELLCHCRPLVYKKITQPLAGS